MRVAEEANSTFLSLCSRRMFACQRVAKGEDGSDLAIWVPPFFCLDFGGNAAKLQTGLANKICPQVFVCRLIAPSPALRLDFWGDCAVLLGCAFGCSRLP